MKKQSKHYTFRLKAPWEIELESLLYLDRKCFALPRLNQRENNALKEIEENGFVVIENFIDAQTLEEMRQVFQKDLETGNFEMPTLAQSKIHPEKHQHLIDQYLVGHGHDYKAAGIAFDRDEFRSLDQCLRDFRPSTLKSYFNAQNPLFFRIMLSDFICHIVESYFGIRPYLIEGYTRRNFPAEYAVMNHHWHRDPNHKTFLLKAFLFLTDCVRGQGPHHYIKGSHRNLKLNGSRYYSNQQVDQAYDLSKSLILSEVKAGTLILEDTRGLHRAGIPRQGVRDLVYAVFMPLKRISRRKFTYYTVKKETFHRLDSRQRAYILGNCVV